MQTVAIGADHGGFELKQQLAEHIRSRGFVVEDCGTHSTDAVDYPKIAAEVAGRVANGRAGVGVIISAILNPDGVVAATNWAGWRHRRERNTAPEVDTAPAPAALAGGTA